jgi:DNA-binding response OmpR family regulator
VSSTVLIVDDDAGIANLIKDVLAPQGYSADIVANAEDAFIKIQAGSPGVILLDLMLPGMDGFAALEKLKSESATANIPVLMVSTLTEKSYQRKATTLGAAGFIAKPFSPGDLVAAVKKATA